MSNQPIEVSAAIRLYGLGTLTGQYPPDVIEAARKQILSEQFDQEVSSAADLAQAAVGDWLAQSPVRLDMSNDEFGEFVETASREELEFARNEYKRMAADFNNFGDPALGQLLSNRGKALQFALFKRRGSMGQPPQGPG